MKFVPFGLKELNPTPMKTKFYYIFVIVILVLGGCTSKTGRKEVTVLSHSDLITISGAYAMAPIMQVWMNEFQKLHPYVKFKMDVNGSGQGLDDLIAGKVDLAMISEEIPKDKASLLWISPVARLGIVPVMSGKNPYLKAIQEKGISKEKLVSLFSGKNTVTWGELAGTSAKDAVKVYMREDPSGATATLAGYLSVDAAQIHGIPVKGETELVNQVKNDPMALSYCNFIYAFDPARQVLLDDLKVIPINMTGKQKAEGNPKIFDTYEHLQRAMWLGKYPASLIRDLNLVSKGKPRTREMVDFIYWIITDGQRFIAGNGYIELHSSEVQNLVNTMKAMIQ
jgi:phosphate transport system substrate-binding protein